MDKNEDRFMEISKLTTMGFKSSHLFRNEGEKTRFHRWKRNRKDDPDFERDVRNFFISDRRVDEIKRQVQEKKAPILKLASVAEKKEAARIFKPDSKEEKAPNKQEIALSMGKDKWQQIEGWLQQGLQNAAFCPRWATVAINYMKLAHPDFKDADKSKKTLTTEDYEEMMTETITKARERKKA